MPRTTGDTPAQLLRTTLDAGDFFADMANTVALRVIKAPGSMDQYRLHKAHLDAFLKFIEELSRD